MTQVVMESPVEYQPCIVEILISITSTETVVGGQFDWGGRLPKSNGGVQRFVQVGWKSTKECNGKNKLDCETDGSSRYESRT